MITNLRCAAKRYQLLAATRAESLRTNPLEVCKTISAKQIQVAREPIVDANIEGIVVEKLAPARNIIVTCAIVRPRRVRRRDQFQDILGLL